MPEVIGPVRPKGAFPVAYSDEVQAPGGGRTVEARLQELAGIMSAALHPPAVGSVQALVRNYALVIEHAEDLPSDISQVQWRIQGNANSHIGVWTPASSKRIPLYLRASDITGLLANADETVLQVDFEASRSGRLTIVETLLITIPIGGTATAEGIEEWAHEDAPRQPVPNDRGRLIEPSELGDYQLSGQYAVRAFEGALYGGNGFEEGQIVFNHAPTSGATNVRIKPHIEELALFTRRARAGARITIGGWSADIASVSTSVSGSIPHDRHRHRWSGPPARRPRQLRRVAHRALAGAGRRADQRDHRRRRDAAAQLDPQPRPTSSSAGARSPTAIWFRA